MRKLIVVGIEHSRIDVLAGEGLNGFPGLPEAYRDELGTIALDPPQKSGSAVARRALTAQNRLPGYRLGLGSPPRLNPERHRTGQRRHVEVPAIDVLPEADGQVGGGVWRRDV